MLTLKSLLLALTISSFSLAVNSGGNIAGFIVDENGVAVSGATVELIQENNQTFSSVVVGEFDLANVPSGVYTLRVSKEGYQTTMVFGVQVSSGSTAVLGDIVIEDVVAF